MSQGEGEQLELSFALDKGQALDAAINGRYVGSDPQRRLTDEQRRIYERISEMTHEVEGLT